VVGVVVGETVGLLAFERERALNADPAVLALVGHRGGIGVARVDPRRGRKPEQLLHDRLLEIRVGGVSGGPDTAHRSFEERVARKHVRPVDEQGEHSRGVTRGVQGLDAQCAALELLAGLERARRAGHLIALRGMDQNRRSGVLLQHPLELGDVIVVVVGEQYVGELEPPPADHIEQRLHWPAGIDQGRLRALLVGHQVGVRQPRFTH